MAAPNTITVPTTHAVFIIDTTAAMEPHWESLRTTYLLPLMQNLAKGQSNDPQPHPMIEFAVVLFRNYPPYADYLIRTSLHFTKDIHLVSSLLAKIDFGGGGYYRAQVGEALAAAQRMSLLHDAQVRHFILVTSTPPDLDSVAYFYGNGTTCSQKIEELRSAGIQISVISPFSFDELSTFCQKSVPNAPLKDEVPQQHLANTDHFVRLRGDLSIKPIEPASSSKTQPSVTVNTTPNITPPPVAPSAAAAATSAANPVTAPAVYAVPSVSATAAPPLAIPPVPSTTPLVAPSVAPPIAAPPVPPNIQPIAVAPPRPPVAAPVSAPAPAPTTLQPMQTVPTSSPLVSVATTSAPAVAVPFTSAPSVATRKLLWEGNLVWNNARDANASPLCSLMAYAQNDKVSPEAYGLPNWPAVLVVSGVCQANDPTIHQHHRSAVFVDFFPGQKKTPTATNTTESYMNFHKQLESQGWAAVVDLTVKTLLIIPRKTNAARGAILVGMILPKMTLTPRPSTTTAAAPAPPAMGKTVTPAGAVPRTPPAPAGAVPLGYASTALTATAFAKPPTPAPATLSTSTGKQPGTTTFGGFPAAASNPVVPIPGMPGAPTPPTATPVFTAVPPTATPVQLAAPPAPFAPTQPLPKTFKEIVEKHSKFPQ